MTGFGERLYNQPTTLVVFNVSANLAGQFWVTETVNVVILYNTHANVHGATETTRFIRNVLCSAYMPDGFSSHFKKLLNTLQPLNQQW